jgi:hypothetical protein
VGVPEITGFGGEGADAGRDGEGASGGFAAGPNPGGNLGVDGAANDGVAAGPCWSGFKPWREPGGPCAARGESWGWASWPCVGGFPRVETLLGWMGWGPWARGCSVRCLTLLVLGWGWLSYLVVPATF